MAPKSEKPPVPAREELDELKRENDDPTARLEEQATEQEKARDAQLKAGENGEPGAHQKFIDDGDISSARNAASNLSSVVIDNYTRRNANEAMHGHFCLIDLGHKGVKEGYKAAGLVDDDGEYTHRGDYGVFLGAGEVDDKGYPVTGTVRLRDETSVAVTVPYEALRNTPSRGI